MNANQIINLVVRMVMRRVIKHGINAGVNAVSNRNGAQTGPKKAGPDQSQTAADISKRSKQAARLTRRVGRF